MMDMHNLNTTNPLVAEDRQDVVDLKATGIISGLNIVIDVRYKINV